jgi:hypothetical protein
VLFRSDAQGRYEIRDASPGQYIVTATKGGYDPGTINVSVVAGSVTTADILMTRSGPTEGSIQGQVTTSVGDSLVVGARVQTAPATSSVTTDQQGRYAILHVTPGSYTVAATKTGYNPGHTDASVIAGQTTTADIQLTNVLVNTPPYEPILLSPANAASNQPIPLVLRWSGDDPDDDPLSYDVYCDTLASPARQVAAGQSDSTYTLTGLRVSAMYYWRVVAHDNRGGSTPSHVSSFATRPDSIPTDGLVAYYPFNGNTNDDSGNAHNGLLLGATLTSDRLGTPNAAYTFDWFEDNILVADSEDLNPSEEMTISAWIGPGAGTGYQQVIVEKYGPYNTGSQSYGLNWDGPEYRTATFYVSEDTQSLYGRGSTPMTSASGWHHIVGVFQGGARLDVYIDGEPANGALAWSNGNGQSVPTTTIPARIGRTSTPIGIGNTRFNGAIDDIRLYNRALSGVEVRGLYHEGGW